MTIEVITYLDSACVCSHLSVLRSVVSSTSMESRLLIVLLFISVTYIVSANETITDVHGFERHFLPARRMKFYFYDKYCKNDETSTTKARVDIHTYVSLNLMLLPYTILIIINYIGLSLVEQ